MSRLIINVGTAPNDGLGDPLRTAYIKCNDNFAELYSRAQSDPPLTPEGTPGDEAGMYAYDENTFYYCYANYDGSSAIWGQLADFQPTQIDNGSSNIAVGASANITVGVAGVSNVAVFSTAGLNIAGRIIATGNLDSDHINTTGSIKTNANLQVAGNVYANSFFANTSITSGNIVTGNITSNATVSGVSLSATGNVTGGNVVVTGLVKGATISATGNVTGGNLITAGAISATGNVTGGNITGSYLYGDGQYLTNITATSNIAATQIANGTSILAVNGSGGSFLMQVGGVANVAVFTSSGEYISGLLDVTGNANVGNLGTTGLITATGNVTAGNVRTGGQVSATGNVTGGNIRTGGQVSATGNVTGNYILGNGAFLSGVITSVANINNGTSNINIGSSGGPAIINIGGVANVAVFTASGEYVSGLLEVTGNITGGNVITADGTIIKSGRASLTSNAAGGFLFQNDNSPLAFGANSTASAANASITIYGNMAAPGDVAISSKLSVSGNITGGNLNTGAQVVATGNITGGNVVTGGQVSATGNITGGNLSVGTGTITGGNIVNSNANGVGNIGSSTIYFNTVFAQATSALYADLAEYYLADELYPPGTVVKFGGTAELTIADQDLDPTIAGIVSTSPAYAMNSGLTGEHVIAVALLGRAPCLVKGPVRRGQMMVSAGNGYARAESNPAMGTVIGKSLEDFNEESGEIEILVGRM